MARLLALAVALPMGLLPHLGTAAEGTWTPSSNSACAIWNDNPGPNEYVEYFGVCESGRPIGEGLVVWYVNGAEYARYHGLFTNGHLEGDCEFAYPDGSHFVGKCRKSAYLDGTWTYQDLRYNGDFVNWIFEGHGILTTPSSRYEGSFVAGNKEGHGVQTFSENLRYEGDFVDGDWEGRGVLTSYGWRYEGDFVAGHKQGRGVETEPGGDRYEGGFKNDKRHGTGTLYFASGGKLDGVWLDGQLVK